MHILLQIVDNVLNNKNMKFNITPEIFELAAKNSMIQFLSLSVSNDTDSKIAKKIQESYYTELLRDSNQRIGLGEIKKLFDKNNITYMCVKGFTLKDLYPSSELRYMCDLDIFINRSDMKKAKKLLESIGYRYEQTTEHDIEMVRKPFMTVELHHQLIYNNAFGKKVIDNALKNVICLNDDSKEIKFKRKEDEYLYIFFHMLKHYEDGGIGIRNFIDLYLYLNKYKNEFDFEYIHESYKSTSYYEDCIFLEGYVLDLFSDKYSAQTDLVLGMGTYGNTYLHIKNEVNQCGGSKIKWLFSKAFPNIERMKGLYYVLNRRGGIILLPFCYIHRVLFFSTIKLKSSVSKIITAKKVKK